MTARSDKIPQASPAWAHVGRPALRAVRKDAVASRIQMSEPGKLANRSIDQPRFATLPPQARRAGHQTSARVGRAGTSDEQKRFRSAGGAALSCHGNAPDNFYRPFGRKLRNADASSFKSCCAIRVISFASSKCKSIAEIVPCATFPAEAAVQAGM
jgi:hypothetical protein